MRSRTLQLTFAVLLAAAAAFGQGAGGQSAPPRPEPRQVDAYGNLRHCDWSARLDNFAVELMNNPSAKGYVVSYDAPGRHSYASRQVRVSRHYLSESRGIDPARLVLIEGGTREDLKEGQTELWLVPEGAEPPVAPPAADKYAGHFSGKFDSFAADPNVYHEVYEMSIPDSDISRAEFAAKLKQQPESVGYIVVRAPEGGAPGAWRRLGRRDERLLKELGVEASRLKALDGGPPEGRGVEIEFWVLPPWAPPPAAAPDKAAEAFTAAARLHTFEADTFENEGDTQRWMLENLAEFLREHPRATALLVAREPPPSAEIEWAHASDSGETEETAAPADTRPAPPDAAEASTEPEKTELSMKDLAERWKAELVGKYGVEAGRVVVSEGRKVRWPVGRVNLWVIPEKGKWPDPSARDEDEAEREESHGIAVGRGASAAVATPSR